MWHILLWLPDAHHILFLLNRFSVKYRFSFQFGGFFYVESLILKDRFLKKMLLKRAKTRGLFFRKTMGSNNSFTLIENNFMFLR